MQLKFLALGVFVILSQHANAGMYNQGVGGPNEKEAGQYGYGFYVGKGSENPDYFYYLECENDAFSTYRKFDQQDEDYPDAFDDELLIADSDEFKQLQDQKANGKKCRVEFHKISLDELKSMPTIAHYHPQIVRTFFKILVQSTRVNPWHHVIEQLEKELTQTGLIVGKEAVQYFVGDFLTALAGLEFRYQ
jgi:hypothetical protein